MLTLLLATALAVPPSADTISRDTIRGVVSLAASPDAVRAVLADPVAVAAVDGGKTEVTPGAVDGDCRLYAFVSPSTLMTVTYTVRRCPQPDGWAATMVESNAFASYSTRWRVAPEGTGTLLQYELHLTSGMALVPTSLIVSTSKKAVQRFMERFAERFGTPVEVSASAP